MEYILLCPLQKNVIRLISRKLFCSYLKKVHPLNMRYFLNFISTNSRIANASYILKMSQYFPLLYTYMFDTTAAKKNVGLGPNIMSFMYCIFMWE